MIIDAHAHLGYDVVFDDSQDETVLVEAQERHGITASVVQPFVSRPYPEETRAYHDQIFRLCEAYPKRFFGMASVNPHLRPEDYAAEAERCVRELHFVGIKITPIAHAANPESKDCRYAFEVARDLGVPMMVHTGSGLPFSDPARLLSVVPQFPQIPVILAHAGTDLLFTQALYLAKQFDNVYLEPSWLSILCLRKALKTIGPEKIMFSADHAVNLPVEFAKYRALAQGDTLEQMLFRTANAVFRLGL